MDPIKKFVNYLEKYRRIPYHHKGELQELWYSEGQSAGERVDENIKWKSRFRQSGLQDTSRPGIKCWVEAVFTGDVFGNIEKYCGKMYVCSETFALTTAGPDLLEQHPELKEGLMTLLDEDLFPSLTDGVYDKLREKQQRILKEITGL